MGGQGFQSCDFNIGILVALLPDAWWGGIRARTEHFSDGNREMLGTLLYVLNLF